MATRTLPRAVIYQLFVRHWGNPNVASTYAGTIEQNGCGKLSAIDDDAIRYIESLGVTHVWLTGVLRNATLTAHPSLGFEADDPDIVKGRAGSPYAIKDYYDINPDLADDPLLRHRELDALIERLHAAGLKVLLDLVPNHVARSYAGTIYPERDLGRDDDKRKFFSPQNDFFYLVEPPGQSLTIDAPSGWNPGGLDRRFPPEDGKPGHVPRATGNNVTGVRLGPGDWYETIKLNYGFDFTTGATSYEPPPSVWWKIDAIVAHWQGRGVDGFRCDFAHWVPVEFWSFLITRARARNPAAYFLAEAYDNGPGQAQAGSPPGTLPETLVSTGRFDGVYDHRSFDVVRRIASGVSWANDVARVPRSPELFDQLVRYVENHDERRAASPVFSGRGPGDTGLGSFDAGLVAAATLYLSSRAPVLVYAGQELGEEAQGASGFSGDDGRSSIFDYVSPPTLRALHAARYRVNDLGDVLRSRVERFVSLAQILQRDEIVRGDVIELNDANAHRDSFGERGKHAYACLRTSTTTPTHALLVVANFDSEQPLQTRIFLSDDALRALDATSELDTRTVRIRAMISNTNAAEVSLYVGALRDAGIPVSLSPLDFAVLSVEVSS